MLSLSAEPANRADERNAVGPAEVAVADECLAADCPTRRRNSTAVEPGEAMATSLAARVRGAGRAGRREADTAGEDHAGARERPPARDLRLPGR